MNVDVDWLDPEYVHNMPIKPHDMTSNQLWVDIELNNPKNAKMVEDVVRECKSEGWLRIYTRLARTAAFDKAILKETNKQALGGPSHQEEH